MANALVDATRMAEPRRPLARRTDDHGRVSFPITDTGVWMLAAVHMERTIGPARAGWESWWANLTFQR